MYLAIIELTSSNNGRLTDWQTDSLADWLSDRLTKTNPLEIAINEQKAKIEELLNATTKKPN